MKEFIDIATLHDITCALPEDCNAKIYQIDGVFYATVTMLNKNLVVVFRENHIVEIYDTNDINQVANGEVEPSNIFDSHLCLQPSRGFANEVKKLA